MKKIYLAAFVLLLGCNELVSDSQGEKPKPVINDYSIDGWGEVKVLTIEDCEYIVAQKWRQEGGMSIIHKQNCKYCLTRLSLGK